MLPYEFFYVSEYTKIDVGWGFTQTHWGNLERSPDLLVGFKEVTYRLKESGVRLGLGRAEGREGKKSGGNKNGGDG